MSRPDKPSKQKASEAKEKAHEATVTPAPESEREPEPEQKKPPAKVNLNPRQRPQEQMPDPRQLEPCSLPEFLPLSGLSPERARPFQLWARTLDPMTVPEWHRKVAEFMARPVR